ncbi:hypothetical protein [Vibrio cyclitrophicus]
MVTASQIAGRLGLSVSWASSVLKRVRDKHYLQRTGGVRNCGGVEYSYWK